MRKNYVRNCGQTFHKVLAFLLLVFCSANLLAADENLVNLGVLELNKTYTLESGKAYYASFTAPKDGWLTADATGSQYLRPYVEWKGSTDATFAGDGDNAYAFTELNTNNSALKTYEFKVEAGKTYCFVRGGIEGSEVEFTLSMDKERSLVYYGPVYAEKNVVAPVLKTQLSFNFNRNVKYASAELEANGHTVGLSGRTSTRKTISVDVKDVLIDIAGAKGWINTGDTFIVRIKGITSSDDEFALPGNDIQAVYVMGDVPALLVGSTHTDGELLTWYPKGDPDGRIVLEYNKKMGSAKGVITYGQNDRVDNGGFARIDFEPIVDGNKIIIDLTGVRRLPSDLITADGVDFSNDAYKTITVGITSILDEDKCAAYPSSKWMTFDLVTVSADIASDFSPVDGANIDNEKTVTIWITDEDKLTYSGVDFIYEENCETKVITVTGLKKETDTSYDNATNVLVPIPEEIKGRGKVTVALHDLSCADGKDYSKDIRAEYVTDTPSGIHTIETSPVTRHIIYNLNGMQVKYTSDLQKGVYIVNGKKLVK